MISECDLEERNMRTYEHGEGVKRLVPLPGFLLRKALGSVFEAAFRLHHYRDVHTQMMRDALYELDCRAKKSECDYE